MKLITTTLFLCALLIQTIAENPLKVSLWKEGFSIQYGRDSLFSGSISFRSNGINYRYPPSSLQKDEKELISIGTFSPTFKTSNDVKFGAFKYNSREWKAGESKVTTTIKIYQDWPMILFDQEFSQEISNTNSSSEQNLSSNFPSFSLKQGTISQLGYTYFHELWDMGSFGQGLKQEKFKGSTRGGSPLFLFDKNFKSLVLSPFQNFKVGIQVVNDQELQCGIEGKVQEISPKNFVHSTILMAGQGINDTAHLWGSALLKRSGKSQWPKSHENDPTVKYLSYWTDNGAYYYYKTLDGKNYEETVKAILDHHKQEQIPTRTWQFDSWWYFKGKDEGVSDWTPRKDIFPEGMEKMKEIVGMPLTLHNRWWSPQNVYEKSYKFVNEAKKALPSGSQQDQEKFFNDFFEARKNWGMQVYEQDWLVDQFGDMKVTKEDLHLAGNWLRAMGNAALKYNHTIQYCMPLPSDFMQSTESLAVSQMRVSDDNYPNSKNWMLGVPSMISWVLGVAPFKDVFWTSSEQAGNPYYNGMGVEPNPEMHSLISTLTAGPVGFGDKIGRTNKTVLMRICNKEGRLIQPTRPLTALDSTYSTAFTGKRSLIYGTYSDHLSVRTWYVLSINLTSSYSVTAKDLALPKDSVMIAYHFDNNQKFSVVNSTAPLYVPPNPKCHGYWKDPKGQVNSIKYYHNYQILSPVLKGNWVLLGESDKWVTVSNYRFANIVSTSDSFSATVTAANDEVVNVRILLPSQTQYILKGKNVTPFSFTCHGSSKISCNANSCSC